MVGVCQEHVRAGGANLVGRQTLDGGLGANGHEDRRFDQPMFGKQPTPASPGKGINLEYFERHLELVTQTTSGAGSTEKK